MSDKGEVVEARHIKRRKKENGRKTRHEDGENEEG